MERYKVGLTDEAKADIRAAARYIAVELRQPDTAENLPYCTHGHDHSDASWTA